MSYDLFFRARKAGATVTYEEFAEYFGRRPMYEISESDAWYRNEDTGVYFDFEFSERSFTEEPEEEGPGGAWLPISFKMNYFRPHPFGLEAEPEVRSFVSHFDLTIIDGQMAGMGEGEYSSEGFLRGWNSGNLFGYRCCGTSEHEAFCLPAATIQSAWRWNLARRAHQVRLGENVFVPMIMFFSIDDEVRTGVVWPDGCPLLLPKVDILLTPRKDLARRRWFRSPAEDVVVLAWEQVEPMLDNFPQLSGEPVSFELFYEKPPAEVERLIRKAQPLSNLPTTLGFDQVLDLELLEAASRED